MAEALLEGRPIQPRSGRSVTRSSAPAGTVSHWIRDPGFRDAVERFLARERERLRQEMAGLGDYSPFRRGGESGPG